MAFRDLNRLYVEVKRNLSAANRPPHATQAGGVCHRAEGLRAVCQDWRISSRFDAA